MFAMKMLALGLLPLLAATSAIAQETVFWPAPVAPAQAAGMAYFPLGTPLKLVTRTQVSSKDNKPGDRFYLTVAESLCYRGEVVVPAGSLAVGEVADMQRNGHFGRKGKLGIRLLYVQTPSGPVRLSGQAGDEGTSGTLPSIATIALAPIIVGWTGMFIHGTSARLPAGTALDGYLAEDMRFAVHPGRAQVAMQAAPDGPTRAAALDPNRRLPASFVPGGLTATRIETAAR